MSRSTGNRRMLHLLIALLVMGLGLYLSALSLWRLVQTATFMRTSSTVIAVVEDVRQRPFSSISEALTHGNLAWGGSTAYQPIVAFTIADGRRVHMALPDLNADDYAMRSELEVRVPLHDFTQAREYRNSALWGGSLADLAIGLLCAWLGYILLTIRKRSAARLASAASAKPTESAPGRNIPAQRHQLPPAHNSRHRDTTDSPQKKPRSPRRSSAKTTGKHADKATGTPSGTTSDTPAPPKSDTPKTTGRRRKKKTS